LQHRTLIANRARALRKTMSEPEVMLWSRLRGRGSDRPTFRRQHPVGSVILDFYCPSVRLAVEVDGATHWDEECRERDDARDAWLARQGVAVLRIPASAVYRDLASVVDAILLRVEELTMAERCGRRPAPSTPRSSLRSADGPPPAASRGR
jgi:very-short-patch-repair endonuclease